MNGFFQLDLRQEGKFLRIYAATDGGEPVNINELAEYLQKKGKTLSLRILLFQVLCKSSATSATLSRCLLQMCNACCR